MLQFIGGLGGRSILLIFIVFAILWIWALVDLLKSDYKDNTNKIIWSLVIIFTFPIGPFLYLAIGKNSKFK